MLKSYLSAAIAVGCLWGGGALHASAGTLHWTGDTLTNPSGTWNRPTVNDNPGTYLALSGKNQLYFEKKLTVSQTGTYSLTVSATGPGIGGWNGPIGTTILAFLYEGAFDPTRSLDNEIEDGSLGGGFATPDWSHVLTAGTDYFVVVSGYCGPAQAGQCPATHPLQAGPFQASLTGPGTIAVPEPATWALMLIGAGGMGAVLRRSRASDPRSVAGLV